MSLTLTRVGCRSQTSAAGTGTSVATRTQSLLTLWVARSTWLQQSAPKATSGSHWPNQTQMRMSCACSYRSSLWSLQSSLEMGGGTRSWSSWTEPPTIEVSKLALASSTSRCRSYWAPHTHMLLHQLSFSLHTSSKASSTRTTSQQANCKYH